MSLQVESLALGPIETNCYIVTSDGHTMIIDPAFDAERIKVVLAGRVPEIIAITHRHWDHIQAVADIQKMTGAEIIADAEDADAVCDPAQSGSSEHDLDPNISVIERRLKDGDEVKLGQACFEVLHTPGHTIGSMCLYEPREKVIFTGDTLFAGASVGRTDLPTGSHCDIVHSCKRKLAPLPDDVVVYPGHGPSTMIGTERPINTLLRP